MKIVLAIIGFLVIILVSSKINLAIRFNNEVQELFSLSKNITGKTFTYDQLTGLPLPVQRYFKHVLKEGQPYIGFVRLKHDGLFKTGRDKNWINIEGEQYFTAEKPGFIWKGTTPMFTARDMYIGDKGRLVVSLLSLFNVVNGQGKKYDEGELQRWLAEGVWFPTNLLPGPRIKWSAIDTNTSKLTLNYKDIALFFMVTFNEAGEITQMEAERYMGDEKKETWVGKLTDYKELNGILVPTSIEAIYKLEKEEFSYAKFKVKVIEYNKPEKF